MNNNDEKKLFAMDLNWTESLKGLGMDPSSIGRAECPLSQRELPTPPPIASRSSSPANKGHPTATYHLVFCLMITGPRRSSQPAIMSATRSSERPRNSLGEKKSRSNTVRQRMSAKCFCLFFSSTVFPSVFVYFHLAADLSPGTACWHSSEGCYLASKILS